MLEQLLSITSCQKQFDIPVTIHYYRPLLRTISCLNPLLGAGSAPALLHFGVNMDRKVDKRSKYKPEYVQVLEDLFDKKEAILSSNELARIFRVSQGTIYKWRTQFPDFRHAMDAGRDFKNIEVVEKELLRNCKDRWLTDVTEKFNKAGDLTSKQTRIKQIPGDVAAQKFFLATRDPRYSALLEEQGVAGGKSVEFNIIIDKDKKAHGEDQKDVHSGADTGTAAPVGRSGTRH